MAHTVFQLHPVFLGTMVPAPTLGILRSHHTFVSNIELRDDDGFYFVSLIAEHRDRTEFTAQLPPDELKLVQQMAPGTTLQLSWQTPSSDPGGLPTPAAGAAALTAEEQQSLERVLREIPQRLSAADRTSGLLPVVFPREREDAGGDGHSQLDPYQQRAAHLLSDAGTHPPPIDLSRLLGLGIGFTPSGDDFLSGALLAEKMVGASLLDRNVLRAGLSRTTTGGATLLRLALAGDPPRYQTEILHHLRNGQPEAALHIARSHGHSSGLDMLAGLVWMFGYGRIVFKPSHPPGDLTER